ncbi:MAG: hypothetical protein ACTSUE_07955 [Promethearchaeota archaeon]
MQTMYQDSERTKTFVLTRGQPYGPMNKVEVSGVLGSDNYFIRARSEKLSPIQSMAAEAFNTSRNKGHGTQTYRLDQYLKSNGMKTLLTKPLKVVFVILELLSVDKMYHRQAFEEMRDQWYNLVFYFGQNKNFGWTNVNFWKISVQDWFSIYYDKFRPTLGMVPAQVDRTRYDFTNDALWFTLKSLPNNTTTMFDLEWYQEKRSVEKWGDVIHVSKYGENSFIYAPSKLRTEALTQHDKHVLTRIVSLKEYCETYYDWIDVNLGDASHGTLSVIAISSPKLLAKYNLTKETFGEYLFPEPVVIKPGNAFSKLLVLETDTLLPIKYTILRFSQDVINEFTSFEDELLSDVLNFLQQLVSQFSSVSQHQFVTSKPTSIENQTLVDMYENGQFESDQFKNSEVGKKMYYKYIVGQMAFGLLEETTKQHVTKKLRLTRLHNGGEEDYNHERNLVESFPIRDNIMSFLGFLDVATPQKWISRLEAATKSRIEQDGQDVIIPTRDLESFVKREAALKADLEVAKTQIESNPNHAADVEKLTQMELAAETTRTEIESLYNALNQHRRNSMKSKKKLQTIRSGLASFTKEELEEENPSQEISELLQAENVELEAFNSHQTQEVGTQTSINEKRTQAINDNVTIKTLKSKLSHLESTKTRLETSLKDLKNEQRVFERDYRKNVKKDAKIMHTLRMKLVDNLNTQFKLFNTEAKKWMELKATVVYDYKTWRESEQRARKQREFQREIKILSMKARERALFQLRHDLQVYFLENASVSNSALTRVHYNIVDMSETEHTLMDHYSFNEEVEMENNVPNYVSAMLDIPNLYKIVSNSILPEFLLQKSNLHTYPLYFELSAEKLSVVKPSNSSIFLGRLVLPKEESLRLMALSQLLSFMMDYVQPVAVDPVLHVPNPGPFKVFYLVFKAAKEQVARDIQKAPVVQNWNNIEIPGVDTEMQMSDTEPTFPEHASINPYIETIPIEITEMFPNVEALTLDLNTGLVEKVQYQPRDLEFKQLLLNLDPLKISVEMFDAIQNLLRKDRTKFVAMNKNTKEFVYDDGALGNEYILLYSPVSEAEGKVVVEIVNQISSALGFGTVESRQKWNDTMERQVTAYIIVSLEEIVFRAMDHVLEEEGLEPQFTSKDKFVENEDVEEDVETQNSNTNCQYFIVYDKTTKQIIYDITTPAGQTTLDDTNLSVLYCTPHIGEWTKAREIIQNAKQFRITKGRGRNKLRGFVDGKMAEWISGLTLREKHSMQAEGKSPVYTIGSDGDLSKVKSPENRLVLGWGPESNYETIKTKLKNQWDNKNAMAEYLKNNWNNTDNLMDLIAEEVMNPTIEELN